MQPVTLNVWASLNFGKPNESSIKEIKLEDITINGDPHEYFVGYNFEGDKVFEYRKETVNVHYF